MLPQPFPRLLPVARPALVFPLFRRLQVPAPIARFGNQTIVQPAKPAVHNVESWLLLMVGESENYGSPSRLSILFAVPFEALFLSSDGNRDAGFLPPNLCGCFALGNAALQKEQVRLGFNAIIPYRCGLDRGRRIRIAGAVNNPMSYRAALFDSNTMKYNGEYYFSGNFMAGDMLVSRDLRNRGWQNHGAREQ